MKKTLGILLALILFAGNGLCYGPRGHRLVGAIADKRLAKNKPVATKVKQILNGMNLQRAATIPDEIKSLDQCCKQNLPISKCSLAKKAITGNPAIDAQLRNFVEANRCSTAHFHRNFHFTDVPVFDDDKYSLGEVGTSQFDVVQMITFCIRVLKGEEPEKNSRKITKPIAVILLAHYFGDIHQPLHVGAEYFDSGGKPFEPTNTNHGFGDQGGNKLTLFLFINGKRTQAGESLHGYWDNQAVTTAIGSSADAALAQKLANSEPPDWKLTSGVEDWSKALANEILPLAREAHERLAFSKIKSSPGAREINKGGLAEEKKNSGGMSYQTWAGQTVKDEIHKGGWRLAALLEEILQ